MIGTSTFRFARTCSIWYPWYWIFPSHEIVSSMVLGSSISISSSNFYIGLHLKCFHPSIDFKVQTKSMSMDSIWLTLLHFLRSRDSICSRSYSSACENPLQLLKLEEVLWGWSSTYRLINLTDCTFEDSRVCIHGKIFTQPFSKHGRILEK